MKRLVSLMLVASFVLSMFAQAFAATSFPDVADTKFAGSVEALAELGVIEGLPDGSYGTDHDLTRAQLAKMLVVCLGLNDSVEALKGRTMFNDVADNYWASGYINAAVQSKIITGYPDGSFKPDKPVSYAEAVTMAVRALGYAEVADAEGSWPTTYMLKAVELQLLDDMDNPKANDTALRGYTAILLWNMLRTPMWKIDSQSEQNGMNSTYGDIMLNVKFPDYLYVEDYFVDQVVVDDQKVTVTLRDENDKDTVSGSILDMDLPRILEGMKVSALIEDYKKDDAQILTLTPEFSIVEGVVEKVSASRFTVDGTEYRLDDPSVSVDDYVVMEVDGRKVVTIDDVPVLTTLPIAGTEVEKLKTMESKIDEDALVIIDGEWATRDDIELGDIYTELEATTGSYYMVAREREEGTFESLTYLNDGDEYVYIEIDGTKYIAFTDALEVYEEKSGKNTEIKNFEDLAKKDNKYLDQDVEVVLNYLGLIVRVYFGEVVESDGDGDFYVVTSNGVWSEGNRNGNIDYISLVGPDGEENTYTFAKSASIPSEVENRKVFQKDVEKTAIKPIFVYVEFNNDDEIKVMKVVADGTEYGKNDAGVADKKYKAETVAEEFKDTKNTIKAGSVDYKVTNATLVYTVTPLTEDASTSKYNVVGFEVEVTSGPAALDGVEAGDNNFVVYDQDVNTADIHKASAVLVSSEAKSTELHFGVLTNVERKAGVVYATIDGEVYEIDDAMSYDNAKKLVNDVVVFTLDNDVATLTSAKKYAPADLDNASIVTELTDNIWVTFDKAVENAPSSAASKTTIDVSDKDLIDEFEDYVFVIVDVYADDDDKVVFEDSVSEPVEGIDSITFEEGDRVIIPSDGDLYVIIFRGFDTDDTLKNGYWVNPDAKPETPSTTTSNTATVDLEKDTKYTVTITVPADSKTKLEEATMIKSVADDLGLTLSKELEGTETTVTELFTAKENKTVEIEIPGCRVVATVSGKEISIDVTDSLETLVRDKLTTTFVVDSDTITAANFSDLSKATITLASGKSYDSDLKSKFVAATLQIDENTKPQYSGSDMNQPDDPGAGKVLTFTYESKTTGEKVEVKLSYTVAK